MPQMMPLNWLLLPLCFSLCFILTFMLIFPFYSSSLDKFNKKLYNNHMTWTW